MNTGTLINDDFFFFVIEKADVLPPRSCWVWRWERSAEQTPLTPENEGCSTPTISGNKHIIYKHVVVNYVMYSLWLKIYLHSPLAP